MRSSIVRYGCSRAFSRFTLPSAGLAAVGLLETGQDLNISPGQCQQTPRPGSPSVSPQSSGVSVLGVPQPCALPAGAAGGLSWHPGAMLGTALPTCPLEPAPAPALRLCWHRHPVSPSCWAGAVPAALLGNWEFPPFHFNDEDNFMV